MMRGVRGDTGRETETASRAAGQSRQHGEIGSPGQASRQAVEGEEAATRCGPGMWAEAEPGLHRATCTPFHRG
ncbi:hypothetical protein ACOMHN_037647 [Nucella lapillus]